MTFNLGLIRELEVEESMGFLFTAAMGKPLTMALGIQVIAYSEGFRPGIPTESGRHFERSRPRSKLEQNLEVRIKRGILLSSLLE